VETPAPRDPGKVVGMGPGTEGPVPPENEVGPPACDAAEAVARVAERPESVSAALGLSAERGARIPQRRRTHVSEIPSRARVMAALERQIKGQVRNIVRLETYGY